VNHSIVRLVLLDVVEVVLFV